MTADWCPDCREATSLTERGVCPFCDAPLVHKKRGGRKPGFGKLTEAHLRALHVAHTQKGVSINQLAAQVYERAGFASKGSCATSISNGWKRMELPARDRIEQVRLTCTTHGMAPKHGARPGYGAYQRRVLRGKADQPRCAAMVRGEQCQRPAKTGIEWCASHDPATAADRAERLAKMRSRSSLQTQRLLQVAPLQAWVNRLHDDLGSWKAVGALLGIDQSSARRLGRGEGTARGGALVGELYVRRLAERAGVRAESIYGGPGSFLSSWTYEREAA